MKQQLEAFYASMRAQGIRGKKPTNWYDAFTLIIDYLRDKKDEKRILIFIDEMPWLDTPRSNFLAAFEWFWNLFGASQNNLMLIVCGSSTSWMLNNMINSHGGLYDRITYSMHLSPFTLKECEEFYKDKGFDISRYMLAQIYMIFGGIPYYLNYYRNGDSIEKTIDELFFSKNGSLRNEYDNLFDSSFDNEKLTRRIIDTLSENKIGYSRKEILTKLKLADGNDFGKALKALINSDFIIEYVPFRQNAKTKYYKIVDPFCFFYLKHIKDNASLNPNVFSDKNTNWAGIAFENLCAYHLPVIKKVLGINGVKTIQFSFFVSGSKDDKGAEIDLLIERKDNAVNIFEMKFYNKEFVNDKDYHFNIMNKIDRVRSLTGSKIDIYLSLITTFGLTRNQYYSDFSNVITLDDLFE